MAAEAFTGNISLFKLIDVLKLLASEGKTGMLSLQKGIERGEIYIEKGAIVHAICKNGVGEEAVFTLLTWMDGDFNFTPDVMSKERSINKSTPSLLEEEIKRLMEWERVKEIIPSQNMVFKLSSQRAPDEVTLKHDEWSVLSQIDGNKTVGDIADMLKMGEYDTAMILYKLFTAGLIEVGTGPKLRSKKTVDAGFLDFIEEKLIEIIGPVASVILEEEIKGMGENKGAFPVERVSMLVEKVSAEITDDAQKTEFQRTVLGALRGI